MRPTEEQFLRRAVHHVLDPSEEQWEDIEEEKQRLAEEYDRR